MSNQEVIDLGSSDEEVPTKPQKQRPNAMVHIPTGSRMYANNATKINKNMIVKKKQTSTGKTLNVVPNPFHPNNKSKKLVTTSISSKLLQNNAVIQNTLKLAQTAIKKLGASQKSNISSSCISPKLPNAIKLPPGITIKKSNLLNPTDNKGKNIQKNTNIKSNLNYIKSINSKINTNKKIVSNDKNITSPKNITNVKGGYKISVPTNNLRPIQKAVPIKRCFPEKIGMNIPFKKIKLCKQPLPESIPIDNDSLGESSNKMWYRDPLETEKINNKEPDNMIEITIEDSPVKPKPRIEHDVNNGRTIDIEDSPIKPKGVIVDIPETISSTPKSKKRLNYLEDQDDDSDGDTNFVVEETLAIEYDPLDIPTSKPNDPKPIQEKKTNNNIIEVLDSPIKTITVNKKSDVTPVNSPCKEKPETSSAVNKNVKKGSKVIIDDTKSKTSNLTNVDDSFHPIYKSFIELCFKLESSADMEKIIEKKIKPYYLQVPKEYTESEEFLDMVSSKMDLMKASPEKMFLFIKDVVDELRIQKNLAQVKETKDAPLQVHNLIEDTTENIARRRQVRKLEKTLRKLHRAIQKLEEQEVDFDDDGDSVYILTERYKERLTKVHAKLCQLSNIKMPSEPHIPIETLPGHPSGPAKRLEKWINRKVPMGKPLPFPDFHDVLKLVKEANAEDNIGWNEVEVMEEARDLFVRCGKKLQRRRQENEWRLANYRLNSHNDPAEDSADLKKKLDENKKTSYEKEADVFNKFAYKQSQLNLEPVEIGDKEAEESPLESGEDISEASDEEPSLESKKQRKNRLKRLINDKNKDKSDTVEDNCVSIQLSDGSENEGTEKKAEQNKTRKNDDESDGDEFNLLKKLNSEDEIDSSDSEAIAISDTESDKKSNDQKSDCEIVSIEDSSSSESEQDDELMDVDEPELEQEPKIIATRSQPSSKTIVAMPKIQEIESIQDINKISNESKNTDEANENCETTKEIVEEINKQSEIPYNTVQMPENPDESTINSETVENNILCLEEKESMNLGNDSHDNASLNEDILLGNSTDGKNIEKDTSEENISVEVPPKTKTLEASSCLLDNTDNSKTNQQEEKLKSTNEIVPNKKSSPIASKTETLDRDKLADILKDSMKAVVASIDNLVKKTVSMVGNDSLEEKVADSIKDSVQKVVSELALSALSNNSLIKKPVLNVDFKTEQNSSESEQKEITDKSESVTDLDSGECGSNSGIQV